MTVETSLSQGILLLTVTNPPVNALSQSERQGLVDGINRAEQEDVRAVVICGAGGKFIAGADIREFGKTPMPPHLPDVVNTIEACTKPVVAAIEAQALGGGLEVALACHYRVAAPSAKLGLPEVNLGLVPGAGGTQRLPRLIDPVVALTMVAGGKPVSAKGALASGLIDEMAEGDAVQAAIAYAQNIADQNIGDRRISTRTVANVDIEALDAAAAGIAKKARGAIAPSAAVSLVKTAVSKPFTEGLAQERETFLELRAGDQSKALQHIFFAEKQAAKPPKDAADAAPRPVERFGVIGAGTMGMGIAINLSDAGLPVTVIEMSEEALGRGLKRAEANYSGSVKKGRISDEQAKACIARITGSTDYAALGACDLIIEAAFESMEVKRQIFTQLDAVAKPGAVLATNTSYLDVDEIAAVTKRPADVLGMHYFSPANIMRLLEVVRAQKTAPDVLNTALALAKRTGKQAVVAGVCNGFIGNRMLKAYGREAGLLILEGASPEEVDQALTDFGMAMGPFAVADLAGIDIGYKSRLDMDPTTYEPAAVIVHDQLAKANHLGQKTGSGFYVYDPETRSKSPNPVALEMLEAARKDYGVNARTIPAQEIVERTIYGLVNEGGHILQEGIAARAGDIDVVYVNGYGFPRHRGGPMCYAQQTGLESVMARIDAFANGPYGKWWAPANILKQAAASGTPLA